MSTTLTTAIVDLHHDDHVDSLDVAVREGGLVAMLHKLTEGVGWSDPLCAARLAAAKLLGVLLAIYAYGTGQHPGEAQADYLLLRAAQLETVVELLCLDLERNTHGPTMSTAQAVAFVRRIYERTGRWPLLYAGASKLRDRMRVATVEERDTLARCSLWEAAYGPDPPTIVPPAPWPVWSLQQYTNGGAGPHDQTTYPRGMPGIGGCDRSVFRGTVAELHTAWTSWGRELL